MENELDLLIAVLKENEKLQPFLRVLEEQAAKQAQIDIDTRAVEEASTQLSVRSAEVAAREEAVTRRERAATRVEASLSAERAALEVEKTEVREKIRAIRNILGE